MVASFKTRESRWAPEVDYYICHKKIVLQNLLTKLYTRRKIEIFKIAKLTSRQYLVR